MEARVCRESDLRGGTVRTVDLGRDADGAPFVALVLRDTNGTIVAYRNLCRHLPVPLDGGTGDLLSSDRRHLVCGTHGATYRLNDGYCIEGPCEGLSLQRLSVQIRQGDVYVSPIPATG